MQISDFQKMMRRIYFHRDNLRGVIKTYEWLLEEVDELGKALEEKNADSIKSEFADVLAWLTSLANIVDLDLEKAAIEKYNTKCPKCQKIPCTCPFI